MSETKPGLPTSPGTYRLQYKGGHEIILRTDGKFWYYLTGVETDEPRDVVCHLRIEPLVAPEPPPVSLVERLRACAGFVGNAAPGEAKIICEAADTIERLTDERTTLRELLIKALNELMAHHKLAVEHSKSTWLIDQIDAALGKEGAK